MKGPCVNSEEWQTMLKLLQMFMEVLVSIKVMALIMHCGILRQLFLLLKNGFATLKFPLSPPTFISFPKDILKRGCFCLTLFL